VEHELLELVGALVGIDSINPDLVPGARGEGEIAAYIADWSKKKGLEVHVEDSGLAGRPNVIAVARGQGGGRSLMLNSHMDTVGVAGMTDPFQPSVRDGKMFGRGTVDTKGALAAFLTAAADARGLGLRGDVILTAVVDEEFASVGTEAVVRKWKADGAIVGEPTGLDIVTEHKGFVWFEVETEGKAAHGSLPEVGIDAIARMGRVLTGIERVASQLAASRHHRTLGSGSIHASLIQGGQELSSYPASCRVDIERRTIPGESVEAVERELEAVLEQIRREDPGFKVTLKRLFSREPLEVPWSEPIVQTVARQVRAVTGAEPVFAGMGGWMDSALIAAAGIPSVIIGPAGDGLHGQTEWVDLGSVAKVHAITLAAIKDFCA
jgi:acetylornithine deacetylase